MRRLKLTPRPDWQAKADAVGFVYHHTEGQAYWDESVAYAFTLEQVEQDLEPARPSSTTCAWTWSTRSSAARN